MSNADELDLDAIEATWNRVESATLKGPIALVQAIDNIRALVAEVRRLRYQHEASLMRGQARFFQCIAGERLLARAEKAEAAQINAQETLLRYQRERNDAWAALSVADDLVIAVEPPYDAVAV